MVSLSSFSTASDRARPSCHGLLLLGALDVYMGVRCPAGGGSCSEYIYLELGLIGTHGPGRLRTANMRGLSIYTSAVTFYSDPRLL